MALQRQTVQMPAKGGLDTKTDEKNVVPTSFAELENVTFTKTGAFSKRNGYSAYVNNVLGSASNITTGQAVSSFKDEILRYSDNNLYSYAPAEAKWIDKGNTKFATASQYSVMSNGGRMLYPTHDTVSNLTCYVFKSNIATSSIIYRIVDNVSGSLLATGEVAGTGADRPSVLAIQGQFFIFYTLSSEVKFKTIAFSVPSTISAATTVIATAGGYDVERISDRAYVVAQDSVSGLNVVYIKSDSSVNGPFAIADASVYTTMSISAEQNTSVRIVYGNSFLAGPLKTVLFGLELNYQVHAPIELSASVIVSAIGAIQDPLNANSSKIYASYTTSAPYTLNYTNITSAGVVSSTGILFNQAILQSKPQAYSNKVYFVMSKDSSYLAAGSPYVNFRTLFLASEDGEILTKFSQDAAAYRTAVGLPRLNLESNVLTFCAAEAAEVQTYVSVAVVTVPTTIKKFTADFSQASNYFDSTLGDNLHVSGGVLKMYDGDRVVEHGFLVVPEKPRFVSQTTTGGILLTGNYLYLTVYKWIDKWGQVHRSATSLPYLYEQVSASNMKPTIRVFTLPFTSKTDVEIEIYRTERNGTIFYKLAYNYSDRIANDKTVESLTFTDTMADGTLISNEALYINGGVLDNFPCDSSKFITTYKGRIFAVLSDGYTLQYSKKRELNGPVEFAQELKIVLDTFGGPATCIGVMDDHVIIFKENAIFALAGEGPNALGEQDDFREPQLITSDAGCTDPNSIVTTPAGLMFKSSKGIYILRRGFTVEYIGAPVEAFNTLSITSATLLSDKNEVRFTTSDDKLLMYDYFHGLWSTFTNIDAVDAVDYNGIYTFLRANGDLMSETAGLHSDNGSYIKIKIVSSWVQLAGVQGFERFYKLLLLGAYKSAHSLKVKFAYDFSPAWEHEATINAGAVLAPETYGTGTYGASSPYGGEFPLYQFRVFPKRQKCEAFRFSIEDFKTDMNGESFTLSNFAAEIGIRPAAYKSANGKSFSAV